MIRPSPRSRSGDRSPVVPGGPLILTPHVRHYPWGGHGPSSFLRRFLGRSERRLPFAEAWFGAHPLGSSVVAASHQTLYDVLRRRGSGGSAGTSPLSCMAKIIDVRRPLSLQVHPGAAGARRGFRRENRAGIPRDSPHRVFRDPNAKPEYLMALSSFELFAGWLPRARWRADRYCRAVLAGARVPLTAPVRSVVGRVTGLSPGAVRRLGRRVFSAGPRSTGGRTGWLNRLWRDHGETRGDPATLLVPFMAYHRLKPGDGLLVPAGVAHTYLSGAGLEAMRSSDNVLRLGLTEKARRPREARSALSPAARPRRVLRGTGPFRSADFRVTPMGAGSLAWRGPALFLPTHRALTLAIDGGVFPVPRGRALFLPASGVGGVSAPAGGGMAGVLVEGRFSVE